MLSSTLAFFGTTSFCMTPVLDVGLLRKSELVSARRLFLLTKLMLSIVAAGKGALA